MKVFNNDTDDLVGFLVNITTEGMMLSSDAAIETDTVFSLRVALPEEIKGNKEITLPAKSIWCDQDEPPLYNTGFQFQDTEKKDIRIIEKIMKKFCFKS
jgi:hypothetical protein